MQRDKRVIRAIALVAAGAALVACGGAPAPAPADQAGDGDGVLTIYSGRNEDLVGPLIAQLEAAVGTPVEVRYGSTGEMAAQLLEEGADSPADLFYAQDAGALGAVAEAGLLAPLPDDVLEPALEAYRATDSTWVATSAPSLSPSPALCNNGVKDEGETDVDCGGESCPKRCGYQGGCCIDADCEGSRACAGAGDTCAWAGAARRPWCARRGRSSAAGASPRRSWARSSSSSCRRRPTSTSSAGTSA